MGYATLSRIYRNTSSNFWRRRVLIEFQAKVYEGMKHVKQRNSFKFSLGRSETLRYFHNCRMKRPFHSGKNETLNEMQGTIRKRLQSILACIFALRIFDNGKKMAPTSKITRKQEEKPRKPKKVVNVWDSTFGKMLLDPDSSVESTTSGKLSRLRVRVPFSVFQMIVERFRMIPECNIRKDSNANRGSGRSAA
jgi:hypothetical protein